MSNSESTISSIVDRFKKSTRWRDQNQLMKELEPLLGTRHIVILHELTNHSVSLYVTERINGNIRRLEDKAEKEQSENAPLLIGVTRGSGEPSTPKEPLKIEVTPLLLPPDQLGEFLFDSNEIPADDRFLLEHVLKEIDDEFCGVSIRLLRGGFSGSRVYLLYPIIRAPRVRRPRAWIAKLGVAEKIEHEFKNSMKATTLFDCHMPNFKRQNGMGCLIQQIAGDYSEGIFRSLRHEIWPGLKALSSGRLVPMRSVLQTIEQMHQQMHAVSQEKVQSRKPVAEALRLIIEQIKDVRLQGRLGAVGIGPFKEHLDGTRFGPEFVNPYWYYLTMLKENPSIQFLSMPLHGDLHADNVQIESGGTPHLIDWGNAGIGHSALDYALLETSIWAHCLPFDFLLTEIKDVLNAIPSPGEIGAESVASQLNEDNPMTRCSTVVRRIRSQVGDFLDNPKDFQYALGLLACSIQQLQYEDANLRSMLVIGHHAALLLDETWGFLQHSHQ